MLESRATQFQVHRPIGRLDETLRVEHLLLKQPRLTGGVHDHNPLGRTRKEPHDALYDVIASGARPWKHLLADGVLWIADRR